MAPTAGGSLLALSVIVLATVASTLLLAPVAANDIDALSALRCGLKDPNGALKTWDPQLVDPCTWFHIICDDNKRVTRMKVDLDTSIPLREILIPSLCVPPEGSALYPSTTLVQTIGVAGVELDEQIDHDCLVL
uniref:Leucine-rich repeat-containing N-terminal plant-type domain-containing protein n=1 Tax=Aegilops tauschii TaxID=37682 RepID=M8CAS0_AEGTA